MLSQQNRNRHILITIVRSITENRGMPTSLCKLIAVVCFECAVFRFVVRSDVCYIFSRYFLKLSESISQNICGAKLTTFNIDLGMSGRYGSKLFLDCQL
jgi:hypothetical protein